MQTVTTIGRKRCFAPIFAEGGIVGKMRTVLTGSVRIYGRPYS